eukprot:m.350424 g.350424  ORF g.350424 m.350424 type:complete len:66 (-) comp20693_c0_seq1:157-354(-)
MIHIRTRVYLTFFQERKVRRHALNKVQTDTAIAEYTATIDVMGTTDDAARVRRQRCRRSRSLRQT